MNIEEIQAISEKRYPKNCDCSNSCDCNICIEMKLSRRVFIETIEFAQPDEQRYKEALLKIKAIKCSGNHPTTYLSVINDLVIEALKSEK